MKKLLSVLLVFTLLLCCGTPALAANTEADSSRLSFGDDGKFTILQVSDLQDVAVLRPITRDFVRDTLERVKPDLVVLTGDNIDGYAYDFKTVAADRSAVKTGISGFMTVFEEAGVPVCTTFGNHDDQYTLCTKEMQMELYSEYDCFIGYEDGELSGNANNVFPVYSSDGNSVAYNIFMLDSGNYDTVNGGYGYVQPDQIAWYRQAAKAAKAANGGVTVPSMMFQHIIVREIFDALAEVPAGTANSYQNDGKYYALDPANTIAGTLSEIPCPSKTNSGLFEAARAQGDVVAMFFGHDHKNTFEIAYKGINLVATPTAGFCNYGDENRGMRVITLDEQKLKTDPKAYDTEIILYEDIYGDDLLASLRRMAFDSNNEWYEWVLGFIAYMILKYPIKLLKLFGIAC